jgi:hypothetical protein
MPARSQASVSHQWTSENKREAGRIEANWNLALPGLTTHRRVAQAPKCCSPNVTENQIQMVEYSKFRIGKLLQPQALGRTETVHGLGTPTCTCFIWKCNL